MSDINEELTNKSAKEISEKYLKKTIEYYKLNLLKTLTKEISNLIKILLFGLFSVLTLIFLSIYLAIYLGNVLNDNALGFLLVSGVYVFFILLIYFLRKKIDKKVLIKINGFLK